MALGELGRLITLWCMLVTAASCYFADLSIFSCYRPFLVLFTVYVGLETSRCLTSSRFLCRLPSWSWVWTTVTFVMILGFSVWARWRALRLWSIDAAYPRPLPFPDQFVESCFWLLSGVSSYDAGMSSYWHGQVIRVIELFIGLAACGVVISLGQLCGRTQKSEKKEEIREG